MSDELATAKANYLLAAYSREWLYWDGTGDYYPAVVDQDNFIVMGWQKNGSPILAD